MFSRRTSAVSTESCRRRVAYSFLLRARRTEFLAQAFRRACHGLRMNLRHYALTTPICPQETLFHIYGTVWHNLFHEKAGRSHNR